jgi:hypothetical protein
MAEVFGADLWLIARGPDSLIHMWNVGIEQINA